MLWHGKQADDLPSLLNDDMAMKSSFLPRISLSGGDSPMLPIHEPSSPSIQLSNLSPHPDDALFASNLPHASKRPSSGRRSSSTSGAFSDNASTAGSASKLKPRALFAGPPPPIAASRVLYRDEEDTYGPSPTSPSHATSSLARSALSSVFYDTASRPRTREQEPPYKPDTVWRSLQRRERALQKELQHLLDVQSAGLAVHLDRDAPSPGSRFTPSEAGSSTPTGTLRGARPTERRPHVTFEAARPTPSGEVVPVRQPRQKPIGLRGARSGLARNMALLADLKAEEDASLAAALSIRKMALAQLRKLSAQRDGIIQELRGLESDDEDPLARELQELEEEREAVSAEILELEERLVGLRNRKRWLLGRFEDVKNRREAGLSGYRGALKEVEGRVSGILRRPSVAPLDLEAIGATNLIHELDVGSQRSAGPEEQSPGGVEFLRMRPERRTIIMAKDWWQSEVGILERRKGEVDKERAALEEGTEVWKQAIKLISDFESGLRTDMKGQLGSENEDGSEGTVATPEQAMSAQLDKMSAVMAGLERHLQKAEAEGWNLLICALGAELEAFREAEYMLREALNAAGIEVEDERTPPAARSVTEEGPINLVNASKQRKNDSLLDANDDETIRSDNEVPPDLLVSHEDEHGILSTHEHEPERDDSENEVPPEFLAEHRRGEDDVG